MKLNEFFYVRMSDEVRKMHTSNPLRVAFVPMRSGLTHSYRMRSFDVRALIHSAVRVDAYDDCNVSDAYISPTADTQR